MTEKEQKAIEKLEIEGTENNYLEVKIVLDLVDKQQETLRKQSYTNKKLRNKIKTVRKERNKLQKELDKKDKVINYIAKHTYIRTGENGVLGAITEEVIEHFYKKAEEEKC